VSRSKATYGVVRIVYINVFSFCDEWKNKSTEKKRTNFPFYIKALNSVLSIFTRVSFVVLMRWLKKRYLLKCESRGFHGTAQYVHMWNTFLVCWCSVLNNIVGTSNRRLVALFSDKLDQFQSIFYTFVELNTRRLKICYIKHYIANLNST